LNKYSKSYTNPFEQSNGFFLLKIYNEQNGYA